MLVAAKMLQECPFCKAQRLENLTDTIVEHIRVTSKANKRKTQNSLKQGKLEQPTGACDGDFDGCEVEKKGVLVPGRSLIQITRAVHASNREFETPL